MAGFTNRQSYNGVSYKVYVPENCNANTEVLVYCHGGEDTDSWYGSNFLKNNGGNTVVIFPTADQGFREQNNYGAQVATIVNNVKQELNITNTSLSVAGFSKGSTPTYTIMGEYLKQNPNCSSSTMFLLDNYPNANYSGINKFDSLLNDYGTYYKNNNTMFVAMIPQWDKSGTFIIGSKQKELDYLAQHGITNVSVLHSYKASFPGKFPNDNLDGEAHICLEKVFWVDGIFNMNNDKTLMFHPEEYKLTILNRSTGQYEVTDFSSLNSLDKLRQYFGINISGVANTETTNTTNTTIDTGVNFLESEISKLSGLKLYDTSNSLVKSDKDILIGDVNNVITDIKNTSFVKGGLDLSFGGSSTTKVPSGIPNIIGLYFTFTTNMLTELSSFMDKVATAGESIYNMDTDLSKDASTLNNDTASVTGTDNVLTNVGSSNNDVTATVQDTRDEVTTVVRDSNSTGNSGYTYSGGGNSYSSNVGSAVSSGTSNNDVTATVQDTRDEVTTVVRDNNVASTPNINNNSSVNNVVSKPNDTVTSTPDASVPSDTNTDIPVVDVPKHDINNIIIENNNSNNTTPNMPDIDSIINDSNISNIPVNNNTPVPKKDSSNVLNTLGVALGVGGALGVTGVLAKKAFTKEEKNDDDNLSSSDKEELSEYKDDYYEEV